VGGLREVEILAIGKVGEDEFVCEPQRRGVGGGLVVRERGNIVVEVVIMERQIVDLVGGLD
jgi:hypothetical protein